VALRTGLAAGVRFRKERLLLLLLRRHYVGMRHLRGADERKVRGSAVRLDASMLAAASDDRGWQGASRCPSCSAPASAPRPEIHPRNQTYTKHPPDWLIGCFAPSRVSWIRPRSGCSLPSRRCCAHLLRSRPTAALSEIERPAVRRFAVNEPSRCVGKEVRFLRCIRVPQLLALRRAFTPSPNPFPMPESSR